MPRYFFNVRDKLSQVDQVGIELADLNAARQNALRYAGEMLNDRAFELAFEDDWHMDVTDEQRLILFCLDFSSFDASAVAQRIKALTVPLDGSEH